MQRVLVLLAAIALGGIATATVTRVYATQAKAGKATEVCTMKVTGMTCAGCETAVKLAAQQIGGVKDAKVSYAKGTADVTFDPAKTSPDAIAKMIAQKTGYKTELLK